MIGRALWLWTRWKIRRQQPHSILALQEERARAVRSHKRRSDIDRALREERTQRLRQQFGRAA